MYCFLSMTPSFGSSSVAGGPLEELVHVTLELQNSKNVRLHQMNHQNKDSHYYSEIGQNAGAPRR